jgi:hypothetical protein
VPSHEWRAYGGGLDCVVDAGPFRFCHGGEEIIGGVDNLVA